MEEFDGFGVMEGTPSPKQTRKKLIILFQTLYEVGNTQGHLSNKVVASFISPCSQQSGWYDISQ